MDVITTLEELGYDASIDLLRIKQSADIEQVARVTAEHKGSYQIISAKGEFRAAVTGKRMLKALSRDDYPAVGDWVIIKNNPDNSKVIVGILPRKTTLHKKYGGKDEAQLMVANVDVAFIVESIDRDYSLNRFERYLVLAREGGVRPVIILNKADLSTNDDLNINIQQIHERFGDIDILATSTVTDTGLALLSRYIKKGVTYCFLGSSGVGKSSLINSLLQQDLIETKEISEKTGRGMHTTTSREMYITGNGSIIIDNPGSREVGIADSNTGVVEVFADIERIAYTCKFKDCKHMDEPGCEVQRALSAGIIDADKYDNYQKLQKETEHYELNAYGKRQKDKKFGKFINNAKKSLNNLDSY